MLYDIRRDPCTRCRIWILYKLQLESPLIFSTPESLFFPQNVKFSYMIYSSET